MKSGEKNGVSLPLKGVDVIITRPSQQAEGMIERICDLGGVPHIAPVIEIHYRDNARVDQMIQNLSDYDVVVLTSANTVRSLDAAAKRVGRQLPESSITWIAISEKTKEVAANHGIAAEVYHGVRSSVELAHHMIESFAGKPNTRFLVPRGNLSDTQFIENLRDAGYAVDECICYDTVECHVPRARWQDLFKAERIAILLFSPSAVKSLLKQVGPAHFKQRNVQFVVVGETTKQACEKLELEVAAVAEHPSSESVIDAVVDVMRPKVKRVKDRQDKF
ncbi:uroporphyrinogen-III synthase [Alicyclobacillus sp. SO9]|uniref:uroporphyrinogen-III synthase n=1 Tax=Alicyclobacillus sp. SO9 TaxID=2665646 RepID=UPI0018E76880|nr:uroporphyrinogen-III synthase [Alicyclobacillus sp. SO9]QQE77023.1 uroporphyrinogen-III synthase [Alicyclobacillus sp. SO9]